ncbi:MAG: sugar ABC transporter permease, partial [Mesorhizobium sp.]
YRGLPVVLLVMGVLISLFVFVTKRMTIGRRIYAMGGNAKAAQLSGINTERLTLMVFINMGVLSALGGLIIAARLGQVIGAVVGGFIMGVMNNGMSIMGVNVDWQQVVKGLVLLGAVIFDVYNKNKA